MVLNAMVAALLGKVEEPQLMLESVYNELQSALRKVRKELAEALATEAQLKQTIKRLENSNSSTVDLKEQLKHLQAKISVIRRKLVDLENEVQLAYTKKQVLIGRDKASGASLVCEEILVGKAITEDGTTFDREIAPAPDSGTKNVPIWILLTIPFLVVLIMSVLAHSHLVR